MWVGAMITDINQKLLIVAYPGKEEEVLTRLSRVGYDQAIGFLEGGFEEWKAADKPIDTIDRISAQDLSCLKNPLIVDVRKKSEYLSQHVENSLNLELDYLNQKMSSVPKDGTFYIHCASGYRSVIAASILKSRGYHNLVDVAGGFSAIKETSILVSDND